MLKRKNSTLVNVASLLVTTAIVIVMSAPVMAAVPRSSKVTNDTAIYQELHEIRMKKIRRLDFESSIARLSAQEKMHREPVPMHLSVPMKRIQKRKYYPRKKLKRTRKYKRTTRRSRVRS